MLMLPSPPGGATTPDCVRPRNLCLTMHGFESPRHGQTRSSYLRGFQSSFTWESRRQDNVSLDLGRLRLCTRQGIRTVILDYGNRLGTQ